MRKRGIGIINITVMRFRYSRQRPEYHNRRQPYPLDNSLPYAHQTISAHTHQVTPTETNVLANVLNPHMLIFHTPSDPSPRRDAGNQHNIALIIRLIIHKKEGRVPDADRNMALTINSLVVYETAST